MKKRDLQKRYEEIQERKRRAAKKKTLFEPRKSQGECPTCGKVTWKPYKQS
ncbi:hypothetical protein JOD45_000240 [Scopulibacillus daqui]|uniref:30S ribosomal protein S14 n=1 Tax=Scopulibacillus daqui TaxID=1469162 RepID=A0ABS2PVH0_9BACL|nr:hypothetical protein [Scopulibacillus daqui]MBM7644049.1 hypothetical protein [Scopulibacillus daqui]